MKKILATAAAALMVASFAATPASAKKQHRGYKANHGHHHYHAQRGYRYDRGYHRYGPQYQSYGRMRGPVYFGGNAALSGNNGNSGSGRNSLGNIEGGNIGGGK